MILVISEKPSVAQSIARVLGVHKKQEGYLEGPDMLVTWCLGHLAEYVSPESYDEKYKRWNFEDLPILPSKWKLAVDDSKKKQFAVVKSLLNREDITYAVNACDAGREGELIFFRAYQLSGSQVPVKRLWISSMEEEAIRKGFRELKSGEEYQSLLAAAICRAQADWLVGMNATRAFTDRYGVLMKVGRVQTPTLAMLVERQEKIDGFVKRPFYRVSLDCDGFTLTSRDMETAEEAERIAQLCDGKNATINHATKIRKRMKPPKLYDLTTLQREANRIFGYTAKETLDILQGMYEDKLITYPRTDSQYITEDMDEMMEDLVDAILQKLSFLGNAVIGRNVSRTVDNSKVSDHHAILPTESSMNTDLSDLSAKEKNLFQLIAQRTVQAVSGDCIYDETTVDAFCEGQAFKAKGSTIVEPGYKRVYDAFTKACLNRTDEKKETVFPEWVCSGRIIPGVLAKKEEHFTSPPKPFNEDTLLAAMEAAGKKEFEQDTEKKGLGTPATRAAIIEKLVTSGYAVRKQKQIVPTGEGKSLIHAMPEYLRSPGMTAEWENALLLIERGGYSPTQFLESIRAMIYQIMDTCEAIPKQAPESVGTRELLGKCPACGGMVFEGKKIYYCDDKDCKFALWKENRYLEGMHKKLTPTMVKALLQDGRVRCNDLYSAKKNADFTADLIMKWEDGRARFSLEFPKTKRKRS